MSKQLFQNLFQTPRPVAFVTGSAADRVGRRIAQRCIDAGFCVAIHSHRGEDASKNYVQALNEQGHEAILCVGSVEDPTSAIRWLDQIHSRWQRIDLLVNSAAIWDPKPLEQTTMDDLKRNFEVNAVGLFLTSQHFGLAMTRQLSGGSIVQIGDWACIRPYTDFSAYFLAKGTVETLTRSLAVELATRNPKIRVNAVLPGPVMLDPEISSELEQQIERQSLLQRAASPEDVADAVYFLATSPFITGVCLPVDGGRSIYSGPGTDRCAHPKLDS
ncbi:MAG: SDR family oxidoreductase [Pirellulales bacterium]